MSVPQTEITNKSRYPLSFMASAVSIHCVVGFFFVTIYEKQENSGYFTKTDMKLKTRKYYFKDNM